MINMNELKLLHDGLEKLEASFAGLPDFASDFDEDALAQVIDEVATRLQDNYPYHHPQYVGQMLKPPHPVARIAYAMSLWINPNNHALDGGRASSVMEKECIADLATMFGWQKHLGHLTSGGTMANLEALWVAGRLHPGKDIIGSEQAHYTHSRISEVLGLTFSAVSVLPNGQMDIAAIVDLLRQGNVGTIVVTIGNTSLGAVDPLPEILELRKTYDFRIHADAAYGGYFGLSSLLTNETAEAYTCLHAVDSIVIDPHKHGLQPYGCGSVLFKDASVGRIYKHDSPYTYFSSAELHLGEISLECSRPGAAAVALWATQRLLPLDRGGEFAASLDDCLAAARDFHGRLDASNFFTPLMPPELDIVVYAVNAVTTAQASKNARKLFNDAANQGLHLALIELPIAVAAHWLPDMKVNSASITCL
ncbi:MAG: aminotransferase class V-fold PLP-dependent enzyme, partial [Woeseiaceae bacterium]|nr:aminotransferase class V-fold PLP-dependent enzyme [Woeseiaceae bacterium]